MGPDRYTNSIVRLVAGAALVATVAGVTGCSKETDSVGGKKPNASNSKAAGAKATQKGKDGNGSAAAQSSALRQSTAEEAVGTWVTEVIKGRPKRACLVMAQPATDAAPAQVGTRSRCNGNTSEARQMREAIGKFRPSFTPKPPTGNPKVEVAKVPVTGDKAAVPAGKVTIDGQTLDKVILSNSTGLESGQLDVKIESTRIDDAWYVTNVDFNIG
ncbi:hypothetical protein [Streptomyces sp. GESEQ-35]|uniref:hypothetical protein n=1 Tax=Streptomyces sp. GESEQ-35 TaxID=2812657 RepID=UPI001B324D32|nr:hypothetical protein [Streptomyces sp. GESEQ-35]